MRADKSVKEIKFFSNGAIPKRARYDIQQHAKKTYNIDLDIFDSEAISIWLGDAELFWIAARFLSIPSDVFPRLTSNEVGWYREALELKIDAVNSTSDQFFKIRDAIRFAVAHPERHSDIPGLISKLRVFRANQFVGIQRRAFYEEFVASLRGLEFIDDCYGDLSGYFADIGSIEDSAAIEDATVLLGYSFGAHFRGLGNISLTDLKEWRKSVLNRIEQLLSSTASPGRRIALMDSKAMLLLWNWVETAASADVQERERKAREAAKSAIPVWRKMLKLVRQVPMFPLENFAQRIPMMAAEYGDVDGYSELSEETDELLAQRVGQQCVGKQAFARAKSYMAAGKSLKAIDEMHKAHFSTFTSETADAAVKFPLFLATLYSGVGLFAAAKYYALASSYAALYLKDDTLKANAYLGITEALSADYALGATLEVFLAVATATYLEMEYSVAGSESIQHFQWGRTYFYVFLLTHASTLVNEPLRRYLSEEFLPKLGLKLPYEEALPEVRAFLSKCSNYSELALRVIEEGIAPPFSDVPRVRKLSWKQLGLHWHIKWESDYETTAIAEGFVAQLQILLADIRDIELSLLRTEIEVSIEVHDGAFQIKDEPDNERVIRRVRLPRNQLNSGLVFGAAAAILSVVSAVPQQRFLGLIEERMKRGVLGKASPYAPYHIIFREFYPQETFDILREHAGGVELPIPEFSIPSDEGLSGPTGTHRDYDAKRSIEMIQNRYNNAGRALRLTLRRLREDKPFLATVDSLRRSGWKDWHILLAVVNVKANYVINRVLTPAAGRAEMLKHMKDILDREELETDPQAPADLFTTEDLSKALQMCHISTLRQLGFQCSQSTPNFNSIEEFLKRFNYWTDDVDHDDPFQTTNTK